MPGKYECPKCGRKFTEWGAEKLGFKCPHDKWCPPDATGEIELVPADSLEDRSSRRAILRRSLRRHTLLPKSSEIDADEALVPDVEDLEAEPLYHDEDEDYHFIPTDDDLEAPLVAQDEDTLDADIPMDLEEALPFTEDIPGADEPLDRIEDADEPWAN